MKYMVKEYITIVRVADVEVEANNAEEAEEEAKEVFHDMDDDDYDDIMVDYDYNVEEA